MDLSEGSPFPAFELRDQEGRVHTLQSILGSPTVIYFYPKDDTSGCTTEACEFRDGLAGIPGVKVLGVSPDSESSHRRFAAKHGLTFPLLADDRKSLLEPLGLWVEKSMYGRKYMGVERTTVLIDSEGVIRKVWTRVKPAGHASEVLAAAVNLTS